MIAGKPPGARERQGRIPLQVLKGTWPCRDHFRFVAFRTMRQQIFIAFKATSLWYIVRVALGN